MSITEFLTARWDEEEAVARETLEEGGNYDWDEIPWQGQPGSDYGWGPGGTHEFGRAWVEVRVAKVRADIAAKRAILADYVTTCRLRDEAAERIRAAGDHPGAEDLRSWARARDEAAVLDQLVMPRFAQVYAEHEDYDPAWKVAP